MRQDRDERQTGLGVTRKRAAGLRHLHQAEHAFVHPRAARGGKDQHWDAALGRAFDGARDLVADDGTHGAAEKIEIHDRDGYRVSLNLAEAADHAFVQAGLFPVLGELVGIARRAGELENID